MVVLRLLMMMMMLAAIVGTGYCGRCAPAFDAAEFWLIFADRWANCRLFWTSSSWCQKGSGWLWANLFTLPLSKLEGLVRHVRIPFGFLFAS